MECAVNTRTLAWVKDVFEQVGGVSVACSLAGNDSNEWHGAVVDSRADCSGRLFFALAGENTDGHSYAAAAFHAGAAAVVVQREEIAHAMSEQTIPCFLVNDVVRALQELARDYRGQLDLRVVAVTGSAGKTTTKELIRSVLKRKFRVHYSPGNLNNLIGVPLTVLDATDEDEYLVCEIGANQTGEIDFLAALLHPHLGVITNIGDAHVGFFGSRERIARAKGELLDHVDPEGHVVLPAGDEFFEELQKRSQARVVSFGMTESSDYRLSDIESESNEMAFAVNGLRVRLQASGEYNALNACAAYTVGELCGVEPELIVAGLSEVRPMPGRGSIHRLAGVTVVDESYNASPASMRASLKMLRGQSARRRIAILGDMKELGEHSQKYHEEMGAHLSAVGLDAVYWLGEEGTAVEAGWLGAGNRPGFSRAHDLDGLAEQVGKAMRTGDVVLVKGSRACNLDRVVDSLVAALKHRGEN